MSEQGPIRPLYEQYGVEGFYKSFGEDYANPHFKEIAALILRNMERFDCSRVLDFSAGSGEVTRVLQKHGISNIEGSDPFTCAAYTRQTALPCHTWSFDDVIRNGLPSRYSLIISSFALHLCPKDSLFMLAWQLLEAAPQLVLLMPHKRPALESFESFSLDWEDVVCTERGKAVRLRSYSRMY